MEAFISRKRKKLDGADQARHENGTTNTKNQLEEESTEYKFATLASMYPLLSQELIMDALISSSGVVPAASKWLAELSSPPPSPKFVPAARIADRQSSLSSYTVTSSAAKPSAATQFGPLTKKGQTLHLYTPEDIARHTPCSIVHNFLEKAEADDLLRELLEEAPTFERQTFKLFDHVVQSPHSACFYVESLEEQRRQRTEYLYNGSYLTVGVNPGHSKNGQVNRTYKFVGRSADHSTHA